MKMYMGYDLIYSEDEGVWYAQDFGEPKQPVSEGHSDIEDLKAAIRSGEITFR